MITSSGNVQRCHLLKSQHFSHYDMAVLIDVLIFLSESSPSDSLCGPTQCRGVALLAVKTASAIWLKH
ncbi:hypothetical protein C0J52_19740 [Blattella germanica]|nr:hypothetical protein C0J52_19740 [Blattella germanica]